MAFAQIDLDANARLCRNAHSFGSQQYSIQCDTSVYHLTRPGFAVVASDFHPQYKPISRASLKLGTRPLLAGSCLRSFMLLLESRNSIGATWERCGEEKRKNQALFQHS